MKKIKRKKKVNIKCEGCGTVHVFNLKDISTKNDDKGTWLLKRGKVVHCKKCKRPFQNPSDSKDTTPTVTMKAPSGPTTAETPGGQ